MNRRAGAQVIFLLCLIVGASSCGNHQHKAPPPQLLPYSQEKSAANVSLHFSDLQIIPSDGNLSKGKLNLRLPAPLTTILPHSGPLHIRLANRVIGRFTPLARTAEVLPWPRPSPQCRVDRSMARLVAELASLNPGRNPRVQVNSGEICALSEQLNCLTGRFGAAVWRDVALSQRGSLSMSRLLALLSDCPSATGNWQFEPYFTIDDGQAIFSPSPLGAIVLYQGNLTGKSYSHILLNHSPVGRIVGGTCRRNCLSSPLSPPNAANVFAENTTYTAVLIPDQDSQADDRVHIVAFTPSD